MPACKAYELTLIIELIVWKDLTRKQQKSSDCVYMQVYMCILAFTWLANKSTHSALHAVHKPIGNQ